MRENSQKTVYLFVEITWIELFTVTKKSRKGKLGIHFLR